MIITIIVLAWLLVNTWAVLIIIGINNGCNGDELAGIIVACLFSPIMVFIIRPIILTIRRAKKGKKKKNS